MKEEDPGSDLPNGDDARVPVKLQNILQFSSKPIEHSKTYSKREYVGVVQGGPNSSLVKFI